MMKFLTRGLVLVTGAASVPLAIPPRLPYAAPAGEQHGKDPRLETLRKFFQKLDCPAQSYAHIFLEAADANALDWRLLPSISFIESTGGKLARNNNLFGWDSGRAEFPSPGAGIHAVAYRLSNSGRYRNKSIDEKLAIYNPDAEYGNRVKSVMRRIAPSEWTGSSIPPDALPGRVRRTGQSRLPQ
jgi:hypothetical protein